MNSFPLSSPPPAGSKNAIKLVFMNPPQDMAQKPDLLFSHEYDIFLVKIKNDSKKDPQMR